MNSKLQKQTNFCNFLVLNKTTTTPSSTATTGTSTTTATRTLHRQTFSSSKA